MKTPVILVYVLFFSLALSLSSPAICLDSQDGIDYTKKIAIVGAGPAGLTAARYLTNKGYTDITVFEKNSEVGGKAFTVMYEGLAYDMGAIYILSSYAHVYPMIDEFGLNVSTVLNVGAFDGGDFTNWFLYGMANESLRDLFRDIRMLNNYAESDPDLLNHDFITENPEFYIPGDDFLSRYPNYLIESVYKMMETSGMGFSSELPALYYLKMIFSNWPAEDGITDDSIYGGPLFDGMFQTFDSGFQSLWKNVAATLNVKCNAQVTHVDRAGDRIAVTAAGQTGMFDALIVACPPGKALSFLDATATESDLFQKFESDVCVTTLIKTNKKILNSQCFGFYDNIGKDAVGKVTGMVKQHRDTNVYMVFQYKAPEQGLEDLLAELNSQVEALGCSVVEVITRKVWDNFPHVDTDALNGGFYQTLDSIQGDNNTYYVSLVYGVNETMKYTKHILDLHFR